MHDWTKHQLDFPQWTVALILILLGGGNIIVKDALMLVANLLGWHLTRHTVNCYHSNCF